MVNWDVSLRLIKVQIFRWNDLLQEELKRGNIVYCRRSLLPLNKGLKIIKEIKPNSICIESKRKVMFWDYKLQPSLNVPVFNNTVDILKWNYSIWDAMTAQKILSKEFK